MTFIKVEPPGIASNGGLLGGSDDAMKVSGDSKEQTTEDDEVVDTDIDKIFSEMMMPPPVSAICTPYYNENANSFSEQLVGFQNSQKLPSDDSKEQRNENVEKVHKANKIDDSKNQTDETQPAKAKKAKYEFPIIADNKAIPQVLDNSSNKSIPSSNFQHDNDNGQDIYDSYGNYVLSNLEGVASDAYFGSNQDFQVHLSSNSVENGDTPLPTVPTLSEEANNLLDQLVMFETSLEMHSNDSMKGSDDFQDQINETQFPRDKKAKVKPFIIAEGINIYEFEELIYADDSVKGSDDSIEQNIKEEDFNDTEDNLKSSDDSQDQTNETHPPRAKKDNIEEVFSIRRKLEKMTKSGEHGQALDLLEKLGNMDINLGILKDTMIGFTVQALKKSSSDKEIILKSKSLLKVRLKQRSNSYTLTNP